MEKESDLSSYSREELEMKIKQLEAHNFQLKNVLSKGNESKDGSKKRQFRSKRPFDFSKYAKQHILLKIAYVGWNYQGFVVQEETQNTIEAILFDALLLTKLIESRETSNYHRCGRTDKGVSAFSQVISISVRSFPLDKRKASDDDNIAEERSKELNYAKILNRVLPHDIRVIAWSPVAEGFSARFDCVGRTYKYYFPIGNLNLVAMNQAGQYLVGEHDFRHFCKMDVANGVVNFQRKILSFSIDIVGDDGLSKRKETTVGNTQSFSPWKESYKMAVATIDGAAFLWHQIRAIMTVLLLVGEGKEEPEIVKTLLDIEKCERKPQYGFASEIPLNLYETDFPSVSWKYDEENIAMVISQFQSIWANHAIKATMLKSMLEDLSPIYSNEIGGTNLPSHQTAFCLREPKTKVYKPLLERPTCDSLEVRISAFSKRRRLALNVNECE